MQPCQSERQATGPVTAFSLTRIVSDLICALAVLALLTVCPTAADAAIGLSGDIDPIYAGADPWELGNDDLKVGNSSTGTLLINNSSVVNDRSGYLGYDTGSSGTANVTGTGSAWNNTEDLYIGREGTGLLNIENGGTVDVTQHTVVGQYPIGTGTIHFNNGTLNTGGLLASPINLLGTGTINTAGLVSDVNLVFDAGTGYQSQITLNSLPGQNVTINIDASGLADTILLGAGLEDTGTLSIADGLAMSSAYGILGYYAGSNGTANVTGAGTAWNNAEDLHVGSSGTGTLNITNGATVSNYYGFLGAGSGSDSIGTANVTGAGSAWNSNEGLFVGLSGTGTVNITNGGTVSSSNGLLGNSTDSTGTVTVTGTGSIWNSTSELTIGSSGTGTLNITNGGTVNSFAGFLGADDGANGTVTVTGAGSTWNNSSNLVIGSPGTGTLNILNSGTVSNTNGFLGQIAGSIGTVTVSGAGSVWNNSEAMYVGLYGTGTLSIENGGTVSVGSGMKLGNIEGASGTVNLSDGMLDLNGTSLTRGSGSATFNFNGGTLKDAVTIDLGQPFVQNGGTLAPGGATGVTSIIGDYTFNEGTVEIELGGTTPGTEFDRIEVSGFATLLGDLEVTLINGFTPLSGDSFGFLFANGGYDAAFSSISLPDITGLGLDWQLNPGGATLFLEVISTALAGDLDGDGFVGITDLNIVLGVWNQNVTPGDLLAGDPSGDGFVGIEDLNFLLSNWNAGTPPTGTANIPEPGAIVLLAISSLSLVGRYRGQR